MIKGLTFRPRLGWRLPVLAALMVWLLVALLVFGSTFINETVHPFPVYIAIVFFLYMFVAGVLYYNNLSIVVDTGGVLVIGPGSFYAYAWDEVIGVEVQNAYFPGYEVYTRGGGFVFSGLVFGEHKRLHDIISLYSRRGDLS